jgi:hypothetical protein
MHPLFLHAKTGFVVTIGTISGMVYMDSLETLTRERSYFNQKFIATTAIVSGFTSGACVGMLLHIKTNAHNLAGKNLQLRKQYNWAMGLSSVYGALTYQGITNEIDKMNRLYD